MWPQAECQQSLEDEIGKKQIVLLSLEGAEPCWHLYSTQWAWSTSGLQECERIHFFCCFKSPNPGHFLFRKRSQHRSFHFSVLLRNTNCFLWLLWIHINGAVLRTTSAPVSFPCDASTASEHQVAVACVHMLPGHSQWGCPDVFLTPAASNSCDEQPARMSEGLCDNFLCLYAQT